MSEGMPSLPIRIVLADDHDLVRSGIKALLMKVDGVEVLAEARDGEALLALLADMTPDIVMTDISMPGMDGITAIREIRARYPAIRILVITMHDTVAFIREAMACGACGYLLKQASVFELAQAVRSVMITGSYFSTSIARRLLEPAPPAVDEELTPRQVAILKLIAQGKASKEIAFELKLSRKTIDVHRARIMERLRLHDVAGLTRYALRKGLIQP